MVPLCLSILLMMIHLFGILQPSLKLRNDDMLAVNLRLDGRDMLLDSGVPKQQDVPAALARVVVLVDLVGIIIRVEDDMSGCDEGRGCEGRK
jgi:hypothetical protein